MPQLWILKIKLFRRYRSFRFRNNSIFDWEDFQHRFDLYSLLFPPLQKKRKNYKRDGLAMVVMS